MADFETCYFCGEGPGETVGEFGVVPAAFEPTADQQRSVVLCQDCREKLTAMMRAVVEASDAEAASPDADERAAVDVDVGADDIVDARPDGETAETGAGTAGAGESAGTGLAPGEAGADDGGADGADEPGRADDPDEADADMRRTEGEGVSFGTATAGDENAEGGEGGDETPPQRETGAASVESGDSEETAADTKVYRKVIRLLQNREFPVQRDEIAHVAASAYELRPEETHDAIDAAVNKGLLVEDEGVLRKR